MGAKPSCEEKNATAHGSSARCRAACGHRDWCTDCGSIHALLSECYNSRMLRETQLDGASRIGFESRHHCGDSGILLVSFCFADRPFLNSTPTREAMKSVHPAEIDIVKQSASLSLVFTLVFPVRLTNFVLKPQETS